VKQHDTPKKFPPGLEDARRFPLVEALFGRRSRRFPLGGEIPDGPFTYASRHEPVPLSEIEQVPVLSAVGGNTGWNPPHPPVTQGTVNGSEDSGRLQWIDRSRIPGIPTKSSSPLHQGDGGRHPEREKDLCETLVEVVPYEIVPVHSRQDEFRIVHTYFRSHNTT